MAVRLVNKSKADCDINLYSGRTVRLKPSSYILLPEKVTPESKDYYRQLRDLGLYLEEVVEPKIEVRVEEPKEAATVEESSKSDVPVDTEEPQEDSVGPEIKEEQSDKSGLTFEELMKFTKPELIELGTATYGLTELDSCSKKQIVNKILEADGK